MLNLWGKREEKPKNEHKSGRKGCESVDENHETNNKQSTETPANTRKYRFIGSFSHGLDAKGRLVIPQPFREKLGEEFYRLRFTRTTSGKSEAPSWKAGTK